MHLKTVHWKSFSEGMCVGCPQGHFSFVSCHTAAVHRAAWQAARLPVCPTGAKLV